MSFSFRLPEEDPVCECKYDEVHDWMDREDCHFHCDMAEDPEPVEVLPAERKPPTSVAGAPARNPGPAMAGRTRGVRTGGA